MQFSQFTMLVATLAASCNAAALQSPRGDPRYSSPTCGIGGAKITLDAAAIALATKNFAAWIDAGADGKVDESTGRFHQKLGLTTGTVTIFACDYKSRNAGSIISSDLVKGATGPGGYLDLECGDNVAGYESSNDLNIGRTASGDNYC